mgnify:CR=1 FL=1
MTASAPTLGTASPHDAWDGFRPGAWQTNIDVRDFILANFTPYTGDAGFLAGATGRPVILYDIPGRSGVGSRPVRTGPVPTTHSSQGLIAHARSSSTLCDEGNLSRAPGWTPGIVTRVHRPARRFTRAEQDKGRRAGEGHHTG